MRAPTIPYNKLYEAFCPFCGSVETEWHPAEGWGRCHRAGCLRSWRMNNPPSRRGQFSTPSATDLLDDCLRFQRSGRSYRESFEGYQRVGIPGVTPERFAIAWARAKEIA